MCAIRHAISNHSREPNSRRSRQQRFLGQLGDFQNGAPTEAMRRGQNGKHVHGIKQTSRKVRADGRRHRQMSVAALEVGEQTSAAILDEVDVHAGVATPVMDQEACQQILDHLRRRSDAKYPGLAGLERAGPLAERVGFRQQAAAAPKQVFALRCQPDAPAYPVEQRHAQLGLQPVNLPRDSAG